LKSLLIKIGSNLDSISEFIGKYTSWLVLTLVLLIGYDVSMRYLFRSGSIGLQELEWHLFSVIFLIGSAYTLKHDEHVRLDIIYRSKLLTDRHRAWIDLFGTLFLLIPFCLLIIMSAWPFVSQAFVHNEASPDPGGLAVRWLIKSMIPVGFCLLLIQGIAEAIKKLSIALDKQQ